MEARAPGGLTQSSIIGTAGDAIGRLGLDAEEAQRLQGEVAVGYAVTYVFGTIGIIFVARDIAPKILGINLKAASAEYERNLSGGSAPLKPGQFRVDLLRGSRAYKVGQAGAGKTVAQVEGDIGDRCFVQSVHRGDKPLELSPTLVLQNGDAILISGRLAGLVGAAAKIGQEVTDNPFAAVGEAVDVVITRHDAVGKRIADFNTEVARGVLPAEVCPRPTPRCP